MLNRKLHYGVASKNVSELLTKYCTIFPDQRFHIKSETTVNRMVGELGFYSDLKTSMSVLSSDSCSLIFDATTQDGIHVNCVMITTPTSSHLVSIEQLPDGVAEDYKKHISDSIMKLAEVQSAVYSVNVIDMYKKN